VRAGPKFNRKLGAGITYELCPERTLSRVTTWADTIESTSITLANDMYAGQNLTALKVASFTAAFQYWKIQSQANGSLAATQQAFLANQNQFVNGTLDITTVYNQLQSAWLKVPKSILQSAINNLTKSQKQAFFNQIQTYGISAYLNQGLQMLGTLASTDKTQPDYVENCTAWINWGDQLMAFGLLVGLLGYPEIGAAAAGVGAVFYLYGSWFCASWGAA